MEKIQQALAKARAAREGSAETMSRPVAPAVASAWDDLTPFTPEPEHLLKSRIMTLTGGRDAQAFDVMRTKTLQTMRANNWRRLAITSPTPNCGKSTLSLNLAFSIARQSELHAMVIELDLRRPSLTRLLGANPAHNMDDLLEGKVDFQEQALCYQHNLAFSLATGPIRNPAETLQGTGTARILADIEERYAPDIMIFDIPPMLASDDAMAFAKQVDCVLLVAAAEETTIKEIDTCERELASQTNFMGVLLNKCRYMGREYGYSYYG